jgi:hypothetical protein
MRWRLRCPPCPSEGEWRDEPAASGLAALAVIPAVGFHRGITHQESRPDDGGSPVVTDPQE